MYVGSTQFQYQAVWSQTFCGVSPGVKRSTVQVVCFLTVKSTGTVKANLLIVICRSCFVQCLRRFVNEPGGRSSLYSTLCAHADLSLATVIHSLSCPFSPSKPSFWRVLMYACRMVCWGLPTGRDVVHHAPSIRLGDLSSFIKLSLESHQHLRVSINDAPTYIQ
jgi:hypothetical protein